MKNYIVTGMSCAACSADVVLMHSSLTDLVCAVRLSRRTLKIIYENLFWASIYNIVGIPIAAGAFIPIFGLELDPMFGAMAMSLSSFFVVMNALRLNLIPIFKNKNNKENEKMQMIITVKGMMCPHCEARVRSVLEGLECVETADVSHKDGTARVLLKCEVEEALVTSAITGAGYEVISVEKK